MSGVRDVSFAQSIMNEPKPDFANTNSEAAAAEAVNGASAPGTAAPESTEPDPFKVLEALQAENAELKDRSLRTLADMENLRRRTEREVGDAKAYGVTSFARDMLTFADNLRRAVEAVPPEVRDEAEPRLKSFIEGIELTERDFLSRLNRFGVKKLEPMGKRFDPNMHEALFEVPDESVPAGTVMQIVEQGYAIGDRVLRPAKVGVSRGGPKADGSQRPN